ncbi:hypothetical protein M3P19_00915 [Muricauda sp. 2012CJ35-5]|uniref:Uncharacterized protein n=1 Tax=Flagellimonas spongiicola TaxID=2942208 RepID=A0ABT0PNL9_9FLAO|nr:hypothetical protein [Allomuricauda spongiicola]MCL6272546.1 hypothetical protein [Allomuricauda spongiicola]
MLRLKINNNEQLGGAFDALWSNISEFRNTPNQKNKIKLNKSAEQLRTLVSKLN